MRSKPNLDKTPTRSAVVLLSREDCPLQLRSPRPGTGTVVNLDDGKNTPEPEVATVLPKKRGKRSKKEVAAGSGFTKPKPGPLSREDVKCSICLEIFMEPVTYPCGHSACLECYKEHVEKTSMQCHLCRSRLSIWSRTAFKNNSFVNLPFWEAIQKTFAAEVEARQRGDPELQAMLSPSKKKVLDGTVAHQGEIFQEFDEQQQKFRKQLELERQREEAASLELIKKLEEEEGPLPLVQSAFELEKDLELARKLQEELQAEASPPKVVVPSRPKRSSSSRAPQSQPQNQTKLTFKKSGPPAATVSSLEEQERQELTEEGEAPTPTRELSIPPPSTPQMEEDYKFAKKLQQEERKAFERERQAKLERMNTRLLAKSNQSGEGTSRNDKKRPSPRPSTSQLSKRQKQDPTQGTLDRFVTASPPLPLSTPARTSRPSPSRSSTPDSIIAEFNRHFQPIVRPPKTPPKRNPDGTIAGTVFINLKNKMSPKNLSKAFTGPPPTEED